MVGLSLQRGPKGLQCGEDPDMERQDAEMGPRLSLDSFVPLEVRGSLVHLKCPTEGSIMLFRQPWST